MRIHADEEEGLVHPAAVLKAMGDPARLRLAALLRQADELCVCEIVDVLGLPQYSVSRQLGLLKAVGVVDDRRSGQWVYYRLRAQSHPFVCKVVEALDFAVSDRDAARLAERLALRRDGVCVVGYGESGCADGCCGPASRT